MIRGWQTMLANLLGQLAPYLKPSRIVTFHTLTQDEQHVYQRITENVKFTAPACGVYLSPSVRNQLMYTNRGKEIPDEALISPDDGVLLFSRKDSHDTIVNALLAHAPHAAAVDVYDKDSLIAGYVYNSIDECLRDLGKVVDTFYLST